MIWYIFKWNEILFFGNFLSCCFKFALDSLCVQGTTHLSPLKLLTFLVVVVVFLYCLFSFLLRHVMFLCVFRLFFMGVVFQLLFFFFFEINTGFPLAFLCHRQKPTKKKKKRGNTKLQQKMTSFHLEHLKGIIFNCEHSTVTSVLNVLLLLWFTLFY